MLRPRHRHPLQHHHPLQHRTADEATNRPHRAASETPHESHGTANEAPLNPHRATDEAARKWRNQTTVVQASIKHGPPGAELGGPVLLAVISSGSLAIFAVILRASSLLSDLVPRARADRYFSCTRLR